MRNLKIQIITHLFLWYRRACNVDGTATERYIAYHEAKAKGGWGLIITEDYNVAPEGHGFSCTAGLWNDDQIESHTELPRRVHEQGATIIAQIYHCGRQTHTSAIPEGCHTRSSSAIACPFGDEVPIPFTTEEVKEMVGKYGDTALRAKKCGFDGVEIHGAHGYLITQFFSPYSNKRLDEYGGNFWNRTRFAREIVADVRRKCGDDFIIGMRISADEFVEGGLTIEDSKAIALMMEEAGVDLIHVSVANYLSVDLNVASAYTSHGWFTDWAKEIKELLHIPVITVSRINDPFLADEILASGKADLVAMGRASLCDPDMPNKAKEGRFEDIRRCIGCNDGCEGVLFTDNAFTCVLNPELGNEYRGEIPKAEVPKKVAVVGALYGTSVKGHETVMPLVALHAHAQRGAIALGERSHARFGRYSVHAGPRQGCRQGHQKKFLHKVFYYRCYRLFQPLSSVGIGTCPCATDTIFRKYTLNLRNAHNLFPKKTENA